jgi:hypothetical protein
MMEHPCPLYMQKLSLLTEALRNSLVRSPLSGLAIRSRDPEDPERPSAFPTVTPPGS